jgi:redox-sensitive bicupin YhaK (pirin superfamily)
MYHAEINNRADESMRFIQMWFLPYERRLEPAVEQKQVEREDRSNRFLPLVSNEYDGALPIHSEAEVYSSFLQANHAIKFMIHENWGLYLYLLESGPVQVNRQRLETLGAVMVTNEKDLDVSAESDAELLLVHVRLT